MVLSAAAASRANSAWPRKIAPRAFVVSASMRRTPAATALSRQDSENADIAQPAHMRAAAQFDRIGFRLLQIVAHVENTHFVAIFLAEQGFGARGDGLIGGHQPVDGVRILADHFVHLGFDPLEFFRRHGLGMARSRTADVRRRNK